MSQARKQRRMLEKALGLRKKNTNFFSKEQIELRERRRKAGDEIHRQNLERMRTGNVQEVPQPGSISLDKDIVDTKINIINPYPEDLKEGPSGSSM